MAKKSTKKRKKLTEKQRRFVEAYMGKAEGNGTKAARLAKYKGDGIALGVVAHRNLRKANIKEAVQTIVDNDPLIASREERQRFWTAVQRGEETLEMEHRLKGSELLGKSQADFIERRDVTVRNIDINGLLDGIIARLGKDNAKG